MELPVNYLPCVVKHHLVQFLSCLKTVPCTQARVLDLKLEIRLDETAHYLLLEDFQLTLYSYYIYILYLHADRNKQTILLDRIRKGRPSQYTQLLQYTIAQSIPSEILNVIGVTYPVPEDITLAREKLLHELETKADFAIQLVPATLKLEDLGTIGFGRYKLNVETAASCWFWENHPLPCQKNNLNCTELVAKGTFSGRSDYDMLPPQRLRHRVVGTKPPLHCGFSDLFLFNIIGKLFTSSNEFVDYHIGIRTTLQSHKTEPARVLKISYHCPNQPAIQLITYLTKDFLYLTSDSVQTDFQMYGSGVIYDNGSPALGRVHFLFEDDKVEVWALQIDTNDVTRTSTQWLHFPTAICEIDSLYTKEATCKNIGVRFSGAYSNQKAIYEFTADSDCEFSFTLDDITYVTQIGPTPTKMLFAPSQYIIIDGTLFLLPPAPISTSDYLDDVATVNFGTNIFSMLNDLFSLLQSLIEYGPLHLITILTSHILDIVMFLVGFYSVKYCRFRSLAVSGAYWYIRITQ